MPQHVLRIARAEMQPPEIVEQLVMQADDVCLEGRFLSQPADVLLDVFLRFLDDLLDPGRMNAAVLDQPLESDLGDFAAHAVETGDDHHAGRVVDDHVDAGRFLESADVASLAADDPAFHLVVGDVDRAHGDFGRVRRGVPLDRRRQDLAAFLLAGFLHDRLVFQDQAADFAAQLVFDALEEQLASLVATKGGRCAAGFRAEWQAFA